MDSKGIFIRAIYKQQAPENIKINWNELKMDYLFTRHNKGAIKDLTKEIGFHASPKEMESPS